MDDSHGVRNSRAGYFNRECRCVSLDRQGMVEELSRRQGEGADWLLRLIDGRPQLFAESPVFVDEQSYLRQTEIIAAIERVVAMPGYQELALAYAPATARLQVKASGVFLGYDFHPSPNGPQLIEINTNAGGGLLNDLLARSQRECRDWARDGGFAPLPFWPRPLASEGDFINMFLDEWRSEKDKEEKKRD